MNDAVMTALQIAFFLLAPIVVSMVAKRWRAARAIGPVVICYAIGLLAGNSPFWPAERSLSMSVSEAAVAFAIPLLLFSVDVIAWLRMARNTLLSFALCLVAVCFASASMAYLFAEHLTDAAKLAGMMVGVYTGGTPNMAAIGTALEVDSEVFVAVNAADVLVSTSYLLFLLTVAGPILGRFLRPSEQTPVSSEISKATNAPLPIKGMALGFAVAVVVVATAAGLGMLAGPERQVLVTILGITTLALLASFLRPIRNLPGSPALGDYFLMVFCVSIGTIADIVELLSTSPYIVAFVLCVVVVAVLLHYVLAALFRLDRDTVIITSTAAIFGPAFVPPVAAALGNREIILSGVATGIVGYAVGNYLGIGLAWFLS